MLGLSTGLIYGEHLQDPEGVIHNSDINPSMNTGIIAWLDFSNSDILMGYDPGGMALGQISNDDYISEIHNLVTHNDKFFDHRSSFNAGVGAAPVWKTGGANSKSYGYFTNDPMGLPTVNSNCKFGYNGVTFFIVIDPDSASHSTDDCIFKLRTARLNGSSVNPGVTISIHIEADDNQWNVSTWDGVGFPQMHDADINVTTGVQLLTLRFRDDGDITTVGTFYIDGDTDNAADIDLTDVGTNQPSAHIYDDPLIAYNWDGSGYILGDHSIIGSSLYDGNGFTGKIYEKLIYQKGLSDADCTLIENHLKTKYGIS